MSAAIKDRVVDPAGVSNAFLPFAGPSLTPPLSRRASGDDSPSVSVSVTNLRYQNGAKPRWNPRAVRRAELRVAPRSVLEALDHARHREPLGPAQAPADLSTLAHDGRAHKPAHDGHGARYDRHQARYRRRGLADNGAGGDTAGARCQPSVRHRRWYRGAGARRGAQPSLPHSHQQ